MPIVFACLASLCYGTALVAARFGLRDVDARSGAAISVPTATVFFIAVSAVWLDGSGFDWQAVAVFALVGLFFPAAVTIISFASTDRLGPSLAGSIGGTTPLFALVAAFAILGEAIPPKALVATIGIVAGVALMSWRRKSLDATSLGWLLLLPAAGAALRALAQVFAKGGLALWPSPLAATLIGYCVSATVLLALDRLRPARRVGRRSPATVGLFMFTGMLNGVAVALTYAALNGAPVAIVVPIISAYPLVTLALGAALIREEVVTPRIAVGAVLTIAAVVYLVAG